jgi:hypothetical protein
MADDRRDPVTRMVFSAFVEMEQHPPRFTPKKKKRAKPNPPRPKAKNPRRTR